MCAVRKPLIFKSAASFVVGLLALTACSPTPDATTSRSTVEYQPVSLEEATSVDDVVRATTEIGAAALQFHDAEENVVLSPASIAGLRMLAEGRKQKQPRSWTVFLAHRKTSAPRRLAHYKQRWLSMTAILRAFTTKSYPNGRWFTWPITLWSGMTEILSYLSGHAGQAL